MQERIPGTFWTLPFQRRISYVLAVLMARCLTTLMARCLTTLMARYLTMLFLWIWSALKRLLSWSIQTSSFFQQIHTRNTNTWSSLLMIIPDLHGHHACGLMQPTNLGDEIPRIRWCYSIKLVLGHIEWISSLSCLEGKYQENLTGVLWQCL